MRALPFSPPPPLGHFGSHHDHRLKRRSPSRLRRRTESFIAFISLKDFFCIHESGRLANQSKLMPGLGREHLYFTPRASRDEPIHPPCSLSCIRRPLPYSRISHSVFRCPGLRLPWLLCCALNSTLSWEIIALRSYPLSIVISKKSQVVRHLVCRTGSAYEAVVQRQTDLCAGQADFCISRDGL